MRVKNVAKNSFFSIFSQVIIIIAGFFSQWVINNRLGKELVGLNGVISNVIAIFSVSELGLSTAITYHLYSAIVNGDEKKIASLMNLFRKAYYVVAGIIIAFGVIFLPFIHLFMKDCPFTVNYIRVIYGLWLAKTVCSYLLSYKRAIVIADQKEYISSLATMGISVLNYLSIIVIVLLTGNYVAAFIISIIFEMLINGGLMVYVDHAYPFLRTYKKNPVEKQVVQSVFGDIKNIFVTRISQKLLGCTDNLILSSFMNLAIVGIYSNYCLITQSMMNVLQALSNALQPTLGNLAVDQDKEGDQNRLRVMSFLFFFLSAIAMSGFTALATVFVTDIWLGRGFELAQITVLFCALNWTLQILTMPITVFMNVSGLFQYEKRVAFTAALTNLGVSLLLVIPFGINGVLLGTFCACLIQLFGKAYYYFRRYVDKSAGSYWLTMSSYVVMVMGEAILCTYLVNLIYIPGNLLLFVLSGCICVFLPTGMNSLLFIKTRAFQEMLGMVKGFLNARRTG